MFSGLFKPKTLAITVAGGAIACAAYYIIKQKLDKIPPRRFVTSQDPCKIRFSYLFDTF